MDLLSGLLLIERFVVSKPSTIGRTPAQAMMAYRGFDGIAWPGDTLRDLDIDDGLSPLTELTKIRKYYDKAADGSMDLVYLSGAVSAAVPGFFFAGFDVGYFESEYSHYSVILNEIIFGAHPELIRFGARLNESLLAPSEQLCREVIQQRGALLATDADIERGPEVIGAIPIYAVARPGPPS
jgi:hypothetical protein